MTHDDDSAVLAVMVERLGREFPDRSHVEVATAVVDAWDRAVRRTGHGPDSRERSARCRLSTPA
jgi:hypothetical protein